MRNLFTLVSIFFLFTLKFSYSQSSEHFIIDKTSRNDKNELYLRSSQGINLNLEFKLRSYDLIRIESEDAYIIKAFNLSERINKGAPHLPIFAKSVSTNGNNDYSISIQESKFIEIKNIKILPSKGVILRNEDPYKIAYTYGSQYKKDEFYPKEICKMQKPYILRNIRGQSIHISPFVYNPKSKTLRIYTQISFKLTPSSYESKINRMSNMKSINTDLQFTSIYDSHFLNYSIDNIKYTPLNNKIGNMLIISYGDFIKPMQDFVNWKRQKGIPVTIVDVAKIGGASEIKKYVNNYYTNKGLSYLLLVGDHKQVPSLGITAGYSDTNYGYINGDDHYIDIFVGRFSAETQADVKTQVDRSIYYEKKLGTQDDWLNNAIGIASNEGSKPSDTEHMNIIESKLRSYNYNVTKCYQEDGTTQQLSDLINNGVGLINYVGHGSNFAFTSMYFDKKNVNALRNINKLPFIFDVACVNGNFTHNTCFAEAWLRASYNNKPTGAIAIGASTINQSWVSPMIAQNEMNNILVETYKNNIKRSYSGIFFNGIFKMIDVHGRNGEKMADTWLLFGDPSLQIRTKTPKQIEAFHNTEISNSSTSLSITNIENEAFVCISNKGEIIATKQAYSGIATLNFPIQNDASTLTITITDFNKIPFISQVKLVGNQKNLICKFASNKTEIKIGESVNFTDLSTGNPKAWLWSFEGASPSTSNLRNPTIVYHKEGDFNVSLIVTNENDKKEYSIKNIIKVKTDQVNEYCLIPSEDCSIYEYISNVNFADIENSSSCDNYSNYTEIVANVKQNIRYKLDVSIGRFNNNDKVMAWIDWDKNGLFNNSNEEYKLSFNNNIASVYINIPTNIDADEYKMRIKLSYNNTPSPCSEEDYGETEDYIIRIALPEYCTPNSSSADKYEYINSVSFSDINNSSSHSSYSDYKIEAQVEKTKTYAISVKINKHDISDFVTTWVDWNKNGNFREANEEYILKHSNNGIYTSEINIPSFIDTGITKMRIRVAYNTKPSPCGNNIYGETEDYIINITEASSSKRNKDISLRLRISPNPIKEKCNIYIDGNTSSKLNIIISDIQGKQVFYETTNSHEIDLSVLKTGVYIIKVIDDENNIFTDKILIL